MTNTTIRKTVSFGVPWEETYGYVQAVQVKDTIYISGQLSHDREGNFIAPAELDTAGKPAEYSQMEPQIRQSYKNAVALLSEFGATLEDVVEETIFVMDMTEGFAAAAKVRKEMYGKAITPCASSIVAVSGLALPVQLVEIAFRAVIDLPAI